MRGLTLTLINGISRHSHGVKGFWFDDFRIRSLLFANDVVLLASTVRLQEILPQVEQFKYLEVLFTSEGRMMRKRAEPKGSRSPFLASPMVMIFG